MTRKVRLLGNPKLGKFYSYSIATGIYTSFKKDEIFQISDDGIHQFQEHEMRTDFFWKISEEEERTRVPPENLDSFRLYTITKFPPKSFIFNEEKDEVYALDAELPPLFFYSSNISHLYRPVDVKISGDSAYLEGNDMNFSQIKIPTSTPHLLSPDNFYLFPNEGIFFSGYVTDSKLNVIYPHQLRIEHPNYCFFIVSYPELLSECTLEKISWNDGASPILDLGDPRKIPVYRRDPPVPSRASTKPPRIRSAHGKTPAADSGRTDKPKKIELAQTLDELIDEME